MKIKTVNYEKAIIKSLIKFIKDEINKKVVFIDLVSVEKKSKKKYSVSIFSEKDDVSTSYLDSVNHYFTYNKQETPPQSLLFLKDKKQEYSLISSHILFKKINNNEYKNSSIITNYHFEKFFYLEDENVIIPEEEEKLQIDNWRSNILNKLPIKSAIFSKITFKINDKLFVSAIWLGFKEDYEGDLGDNTKLYIENFLRTYSINSIASDLISMVQKNSLKSSLAAVMSRNMSHNIGSHVLNKLSSKENIDLFFNLNNKNKLFLHYNNDSLQTAPYKTPDEIYQISKYFTDIKENSKPRELARVFNDYLKKRMDFVADVATTDRATILNSKFLFSDVFKNFERNLLLVHNISGKEKKFKFKFKFIIVNIKNEEQPFYDPIVAMPNDILGSQAFYIVLENIIRNTAKHSGAQFDDTYKQVTFTIKIDDDSFYDFYRVSIYDDISWKKGNISEDEASLKYQLFIDERNKSIASRILKDNQIRKNGWGTIELKIAACYLSRVSTSEIEEYKYSPITSRNSQVYSQDEIDKWNNVGIKYRINKETKEKAIPLIQAIDGSDDKTSGFGYRFLMKKPKEILILDKKRYLKEVYNTKYNSVKKNLNKFGITIINSIEKDSSYNHNILIVLSDENINYRNNFYLPQRQVIINTNNECTHFDGFKLKDNIKVKAIKDNIDSTINNKLYTELSNMYWSVSEIFYDQDKISVSQPDGFNYGILTDNEKIVDSLKKTNRFDHHGKSINYTEYGYYEPFGSSSILSVFLESTSNKFEKIIERQSELKKLSGREKLKKIDEILFRFRLEPKNMLVQAAKTKILIIDERIQSSLSAIGFTSQSNQENENGKSYTFEELFDLTNINVPKTTTKNKSFKVDLNSTNLNLVRDEILDYIEDQSSLNDFVVIHFGILETMRDDDNDLNSIVTKIKNYFDVDKAKLIITSGRGFTPDIKELNLPFVSYSALSNYLIDPNNRSKLHLTELLKSIRL